MLILLVIVGICSAATADLLTCRDCRDVADPHSCANTVICGENEICVTREYKNHLGVQGFRLECESKQACDLLKYIQPVMGRRAAVDDHALCHECCDTDECNVNLCGSAVNNSTQSEHTPNGGGCKGCGDPWLSFNQSCYLMGIGALTWHQSKTYCEHQGGYLIAFNTKEEHDFIKHILLEVNATHVPWLWIGGVYSHVADEWEWLDGRVPHYTPWQSASMNNFHAGTDQYAAIVNPPGEREPHHKHAPLTYGSDGYQWPYICEKHN